MGFVGGPSECVLRFVVGGVTLFQGIQDGRPGAIVAGGLGAAVIALTYLIPRLRRGWEANLTAIGDLWIQQSGMSQPYAAFLRRCPHTPATAERILALDPPRDTWPHPIQQTTGSSHGRPSPP